jgi:pantoate--beta-alanine ligase
MQVVRGIPELHALREKLPEPIGFVPTMGALHAGHAALVQRARSECASVVASIFVNPMQFGPQEDFTRYPRAFERDRELLETHGVDVVFTPEQSAMYPQKPTVKIDPGELGSYFEGASRPGHFAGVALVVLKLFHLVRPQQAFFGQKDAQQLAIIRRMVRDLSMPIEVVSCATVREPDGVALSSRNAYLSPAERRAAVNLSAALQRIAHALAAGQTDIRAVIASASETLAPLRCDYLGVVEPDAFVPLAAAPPRTSLLAVGAAFAGDTRLIDNVAVQTP